MLSGLQHVLESSITGFPVLLYEKIDGLTIPTNNYPDADLPFMVIPLHITGYQPITPTSVATVISLPIMSPKGLSYGGQAVEHGPRGLPKFQIDGFIDTPCEVSGTFYIPRIIDSSGIRYTWGEIIAMCLEGRANVTSGWERRDPLIYRDPWGRGYANPRILDFAGAYVDAVPQRTQFTMTLAV